jgi:hypothetical protein
VSEAGPARILFDAALPFDRMRLKLFAVEAYPLEKLVFTMNGRRTPIRIEAEGNRWSLTDLGPFEVRPAWNELVITPPCFMPAGTDMRQVSGPRPNHVRWRLRVRCDSSVTLSG